MKIIQKNVFPIICSTVDKLVDLVKPTFGPSGNKVIIGKGFGVSVLDDGVQIAKDLELDNKIENYILQIVKNVAIKTNEKVGDGTTGSLIVLQGLLKEIKKSKLVSNKIVEELEIGLKEAIEQIRKLSKPIKTKSDLEKVALISFNNGEVAKLLSEIVFKIGENGLIDVQSSQGLNIESEMVAGFKIDKGFVSPYLITEKDSCIIENTKVLVTNKTFLMNQEIVPILEDIVKSGGNSLVVFCKDFGGEALSTAIINKLKGGFRLLPVQVNEEEGTDIALLTGASYVTDRKIEMSDFGKAKKIVSKADNTIIIGGDSKKEDINNLIKELKSYTVGALKEKAERRLANLTSSVAIIKVGASTEDEAKALKYKVEDASNAVRVAFRSGVVVGAGETLSNIKTSSKILNKALEYPKKQLIQNMGEFNLDDSIIDPTEVLIAGVESAVSITKLLVTTKGIIVDTK